MKIDTYHFLQVPGQLDSLRLWQLDILIEKIERNGVDIVRAVHASRFEVWKKLERLLAEVSSGKAIIDEDLVTFVMPGSVSLSVAELKNFLANS